MQTIRGQTLILTRNFTFTAPASAAAINKQPKTIQFEINASQDKPYPVTPPLVRVMIPDGYRVVSNSDCKIITAGGILLPTYVKEWNQKESTLIDLYMYLESELADHPPLFEYVATHNHSRPDVTGCDRMRPTDRILLTSISLVLVIFSDWSVDQRPQRPQRPQRLPHREMTAVGH